LAGGAAGAGMGLALAGPAAGSAGAAARGFASRGGRLRARAGGTVRRGIQHFRSRPDLRPPEIVINVPARGVTPGLILTDCSSSPTQQGALIMDRTGRVVWYRPVSKGPSVHRAFNLRVQRYQGKPVLTWFVGAALFAHGYGHYEIRDQRYRQVAEVHAANGYQSDLHEFLLTEEGTALFTCYGRATADLSGLGGPRSGEYFYGVVQEVDVATGRLLFQWRSDQHVGFGASYQHLSPGQSEAWDYFHINSIAIDPVDGHLLVSSRNTWACYKVHRETGNVIWTLGGKHSDFNMGSGTHFAFQHDVSLHPGGVLTMFDNEAGPPDEESQSRGLVLAINERSRQVRFLRQYHHHPPVLSGALGSVQPLGDGHTLIGWGASGYVTEYGRKRQVLFDAAVRASASYRAFKQTWVATPDPPPDVVVTRSGARATVYVSWNGATEVERWRVLGGDAVDSLAPLGTVGLHGFETEITVRGAPAYLAVQALDRAGEVLGVSRAVHGAGRG
jgi:hypothetical protein